MTFWDFDIVFYFHFISASFLSCNYHCFCLHFFATSLCSTLFLYLSISMTLHGTGKERRLCWWSRPACLYFEGCTSVLPVCWWGFHLTWHHFWILFALSRLQLVVMVHAPMDRPHLPVLSDEGAAELQWWRLKAAAHGVSSSSGFCLSCCTDQRPIMNQNKPTIK